MPVDAGEDPEAARALRAYAVPLLVALRDGREQGRRLGAVSVPDVRAVFEAALAGRPLAAPAPAAGERGLRAVAGLGLLAMGIAGGRWWLVAAGVLLLLYAFQDRLRVR